MTPVTVRPRFRALPGTTRPSFSSSATIDSDTITRSAAAPLTMRSRWAKAGAKVTSSVLPLARSNSGPIASTIDFTAPALRTFTVGMIFSWNPSGRVVIGRNKSQTSSATSTTSRSLAHCSSSASTLPSSVEAKPHCGDRHSWSSGAYFVASSMRRLMKSLCSIAAGLRGDQAEHHGLALRQEAQRLEPAGAVGVPFEEIAVDIDPIEQQIGDRLIAARGDEGRAEIAATHMRRDDEVARPALQRGIDHAGIDLALLVRIVAAVGQHLALRRIAQIGKAAIVELQIAAAGGVETWRSPAYRPGRDRGRIPPSSDRRLDRSSSARRDSAASTGSGSSFWRVRFVFAFRNSKCAICGWCREPSLPLTYGASAFDVTPANLMPSASTISTPSSPARKSKCQ